MSSKKKSSTKPKPSKRPKQLEAPLTGPGVETMTDKKLIALGDEFIDLRDQKAVLATQLSDTEKNILARMDELGVQVFRFGDQEIKAKAGARHVKIKTVKVEGGEAGDENGEQAPVDETEGGQ